mgnify:CR=1 FL=1
MEEFEKKFNFDNPDYSEIPSHRFFRTELLRELSRFADRGECSDIIEVGAGSGEYANFLRKNGFHVSVIEPSESGQALIQERFPEIQILDVPVYSSFRVSDSNTAILALEVIEHCFDPRLFLERIFESLEDGLFVVSTPFHGYWKNLVLSAVDGWDEHFTVDWKNGHIKFFSERTLRAMLESVGFKIVKIQRYGRIPVLARGMVFYCVK